MMFYLHLAIKVAGTHQKRSKFHAVIKNVLAAFFRGHLKKIFSILFGETTDIGATKVLDTAVWHVNLSLEKVVSTFLGMIDITDGSAETLDSCVNELVTNIAGLNPDQCCGLGSDNVAANVGAIFGARA